jgi:hypothetical protein
MSNENLIREVDDELRSDRMRQLWRQAGPWVIGAAVAVVLAVAVNEGWSWWQDSNYARSADAFYSALDLANGTDAPAATAALDKVIAEGSGAYPVLARFREASLLGVAGKVDEAAAAYDAIAASEKNAHLRDLAYVFSALALVDKGDVAQVEQRVTGFVVSAHPLRNVAREALGLVKYKAGQLDAARADFEAILNDTATSRDTSNRVGIYVQQLIAEGAKEPPKPEAAAAPADAAPADTTAAPAAK